MSISRSIFQKDLYELTRRDLENFFSTEQEETSVLEFKEGNIDIEKLPKEVAAFLNTDGGLLILGAPREQLPAGKSSKVCVGDLTACKIKNQDIILHALGSNIAPGPVGIRIKTIEIEDGNVYVIEVPQSVIPPHQVSKAGIYYLRLEREAKPAPHGLVEALFQKRQKPDVRVKVVTTSDNSIYNPTITLKITTTNESHTAAEGIGYMVDFVGVTSAKNVLRTSELTVHDELADDSEYVHNMVVVKYTKLVITYTVQSAMPYFAVSIVTYGKDIPYQVHNCIISQDGEVVEDSVFDGENKEDGNNRLHDLYFNYVDKKYESIFTFADGYGRVERSVSEKFTAYFTSRKSYLPITYNLFFRYTDGFMGTIGPFHVHFLNQAGLLGHPGNEINFQGEYQMTIGTVDTLEIGMRYDGKSVVFGTLHPYQGNRIKFIPLATSFFRLLDKFQKHGNSSPHTINALDKIDYQ